MLQTTAAQETVQAVEESLAVAALLAACGGFLDSFTYLGHGHVFANAMSGNVVLLGVNAASGKWSQSLAHLRPILAFLLGVAVAQCFRLPRFRGRMPAAPIAALALQILVCLICGCFPDNFAGTPLVLAISFVAALQSSTFRKAGQWTYNSTMTTGNLSHFGEAIFQGTLGMRDAASLAKARTFASICAAFLAGAIVGAICTMHYGNRALWVVGVGFLGLWIRLFTGDRLSHENSPGCYRETGAANASQPHHRD